MPGPQEIQPRPALHSGRRVPDHQGGDVMPALGLAGPFSHLAGERLPESGLLMSAAEAFSRNLGYVRYHAVAAHA